MDNSKVVGRQDLDLISHVGITLDESGCILDSSGNPGGRKGTHNSESGRRRNAFTEEDDEFLFGWIQKAINQGLSINIRVFEDLESLNPRHTALSWQSRWKKTRQQDASQISEPTSTLCPASIPLTTTIHETPGQQRPNTAAIPAVLPPPVSSPTSVVSWHSARTASENTPSDIEKSKAELLSIARYKERLTGVKEYNYAQNKWHLPTVPRYALVESRITPGQAKGLEWMSVNGKRRFEAQEAHLLSRWGVTPEHSGTCLLVPYVWSDLDPSHIIPTFNLDVYLRLDSLRLVFSMLDHATLWARASAWFKSAPHTGVEWDNFLGIGMFLPMEGSHLCHLPFCINPFHLCYETVKINESRKRCHTTAQDLRKMGLPIPKYCTNHQDTGSPCLLQHAALTPLEALLIQFYIVCQAKGLADVSEFQPSGDHPFPTFETKLPVSFGNSIACDPAYMTSTISDIKVAQPPLHFFCNHCTAISTFKSLPGYWAHIRDSHSLVSKDIRLQDIIHSGRSWQAHKESCQAQGDTININDVTWKQAEQIKDPGFNWDVVTTWKLAYTRKRKFGKDSDTKELSEETGY